MSHTTELHDLALQYGLPVIQLDGFGPQTEATSLVPLALALRLKALPLARVGCVLTVVISDPLAITVVDALRFHTGLSVEVVIAPLLEIEAHTPRFYGVTSEPDQPEVELVEQPEEYTETQAATFDQKAQVLAEIACNTVPLHLRCKTRRHFWAGNIDLPAPDVERLYADAMRSLGVEVQKEKS